MKLHPSKICKKSRAFTLVEAVVALGVISFSLVAVVNVLPAGLESQKQAVDQSFGTHALSRVTEGLRGVRRDSSGKLEFLAPVRSVNVSPGQTTLYLLGNGELTSNAARAVGRVQINQLARTGNLQPVHVSIAWPARAEFVNSTWTKAEGSASTFLYLTLPQ